MKFVSFLKICLVTALLVLGACAQPEGDSTSADTGGAKLDMSKGPNKVTADDYAVQPVPTGDPPLDSVDTDGNIAPFGQASRIAVEVSAAPAAANATAAPLAYAAQCTACHGADAKGIEGLGLDLTASALVSESSEADLVEFLKIGRLPTDPASVTGIPMPGFAWMEAGDLTEIAVYLKTL